MVDKRLKLLACLSEAVQLRPAQTARAVGSVAIRNPLIRPITRSFHKSCCRHYSSATQAGQVSPVASYIQSLPQSCPGCGALTHADPKNKAGFYGRRAVQREAARLAHDVTSTTTKELDLDEEGEQVEHGAPSPSLTLSHLVCDRCHELSNERLGQSIAHPSLDSIAATIEESPYEQNHVYHVIDAADFPASFVPKIFEKLELVRQRTRNRRAKSTMFKGGRTTTVSFIITRADILCPSKEQTDQLMPMFANTLRDILSRHNQQLRMGNVHLVSSKRGWWTKEIKEDIRERGGANWMVGKVNVGKSNLFEVLYPKASRGHAQEFSLIQEEVEEIPEDESSILMPPAQPLVPYPVLPLVSSLPGTTASPIRIPFVASKGRRGELIDLPGLFRTPLEAFVAPEHQTSLVMTKRPIPQMFSMRPHQSLLIGGGLIRITPHDNSSTVNAEASNPFEAKSIDQTREVVILAHPFLPQKVPTHLTSTMKAASIQDQSLESGIETILAPNVGPKMESAGIFTLDKDVTRFYAAKLLNFGPRKERKRVEDLPFRIYSTDIVIEGVGWVELTAQVRLSRSEVLQHIKGQKKANTFFAPLEADDQKSSSATDPIDENEDLSSIRDQLFESIPKPQVQVFSPAGKGVLKRETMGIYNLIMQHEKQATKGPKGK